MCVEWSIAQRQFSVQHLRICDDILARPPLRHTHHSLELQRLHQHRCRGAQRRGRYVLRERRAERVAVPTSLDCRCGHGRIQEQRWQSGANQLGVAPVAADRVRTGSVSSRTSRKMEWLTDMISFRCSWLRRNQQRRLGVVDDVLHLASGWIVLRRRARGCFRG